MLFSFFFSWQPARPGPPGQAVTYDPTYMYQWQDHAALKLEVLFGVFLHSGQAVHVSADAMPCHAERWQSAAARVRKSVLLVKTNQKPQQLSK